LIEVGRFARILAKVAGQIIDLLDKLCGHAHEIYTQHRGKFIVVAGEELFVGDTPEEANALAKAAHPEDKGRLGRYIYPKKMARVYGNQRRMAIL
jgi:hypothetical protein